MVEQIQSPYRYDDTNWRLLVRDTATEDGRPQWRPRQTIYGSPAAARCGLVPLTDYPDKLIDPKDYKEAILACHETESFPYYYEKRHGLRKPSWDQDGYGFCWAYGITMALMSCRVMEGRTHVRLAPFSLGYLTGWRNAGWYCDSAIKAARDRGVASAEYVPEYNLNPKTFKSGWEENALNYRALEWWDTRWSSEAAMVQQLVTIMCSPRPGYPAFNWWGHALQCCALNWNESVRNNIEVVLENSHAENDVIILTGQRAVPDELYGVRASSFPR